MTYTQIIICKFKRAEQTTWLSLYLRRMFSETDFLVEAVINPSCIRSENGQIHFKNLAVNDAKFLKCL